MPRIETNRKVTIPFASQAGRGINRCPSDLYSFLHQSEEQVTLKVNSEDVALDIEKGFARIRRRWKSGDIIELNLPMPTRRIIVHEKVKADRGKVALQRGPLVYCFEGVDNDGQVLDRIIPDDLSFKVEFHPDLLGGVNILKSENGKEPHLVAIPYYAWSHRGVGEMAVWLPGDKAK